MWCDVPSSRPTSDDVHDELSPTNPVSCYFSQSSIVSFVVSFISTPSHVWPSFLPLALPLVMRPKHDSFAINACSGRAWLISPGTVVCSLGRSWYLHPHPHPPPASHFEAVDSFPFPWLDGLRLASIIYNNVTDV